MHRTEDGRRRSFFSSLVSSVFTAELVKARFSQCSSNIRPNRWSSFLISRCCVPLRGSARVRRCVIPAKHAEKEQKKKNNTEQAIFIIHYESAIQGAKVPVASQILAVSFYFSNFICHCSGGSDVIGQLRPLSGLCAHEKKKNEKESNFSFVRPIFWSRLEELMTFER